MLARALASVIPLLLLVSLHLDAPRVHAQSTGYQPLSSLARRLQFEQTSVVRDESGRAISVFGIPSTEARMVFLAVDRQRALPDGYVPPDLVAAGGRTVRALARPDLQAMIEGAASEGVELAPISIYRGPDEQALAFESGVWQVMAREGGRIDLAEAEARTARFVAPPGHSQHQLGTAVDFSSWEINYALQPRFEETVAGHWLEANAWQYGFVLSYSRHGEERSGYAFEPWHYRWVGRDLAAVMHHEGYEDHPTLIADDFLRATEEILTYERIP
ncbi:MAG: M15 family metallopeptidase [Chloroflexota bacterium]